MLSLVGNPPDILRYGRIVSTSEMVKRQGPRNDPCFRGTCALMAGTIHRHRLQGVVSWPLGLASLGPTVIWEAREMEERGSGRPAEAHEL